MHFLVLKVSPTNLQAPLAPHLHIQDGPAYHGRVKCCHLLTNVGLKLVQGGRERTVNLGLKEAPEEEVTWVEVW